jgi:hypothetical protein
MAGTSLRCGPIFTLTLLVGAALPAAASAFTFCCINSSTLIDEINQAGMVLYGTLTNAKPDDNDEPGQGTTDLHIEAIIKAHEILGKNQKVITLPRYVPPTDKKLKHLIFCDPFKGKVDPYRGVPVSADSDLLKYIKGALEVKDKDIRTRLRYYFDYLGNKELEISNDAYKVFSQEDYKDYRDLAKKLPADLIAKWLEDPNTPSYRYDLLAKLLGHCGQDKHAVLLRKMLDDPRKRGGSGFDGFLIGYTLLKPKEGWAYVKGILEDPKKDFMVRYAALRTVRFFYDWRPDVVKRKVLIEGTRKLLKQSDVADLAIEDLRKWKNWDSCDQILALHNMPSFNVPIVRRAILRFALCCPGKKAEDYVEQCRKKDPQGVQDVFDLLIVEYGEAPIT